MTSPSLAAPHQSLSSPGLGLAAIRPPALAEITALAGALAISGLAELLLQRIVYRVGVHIPRDGAFLEVYRFATFGGDFAFRTTAVLVALTAFLAIFWLLRGGQTVTALFLGGLWLANALAWPLGSESAGYIAPLVLAFAVCWLAGRFLISSADRLLGAAVAAAAAALILSQYRTGMAALTGETIDVGTAQLASETAILLAACLAAMSAAAPGFRPTRSAVAASAIVSLALAGSYVREPATVAIVSLWATGVTMSLPAPLYIAGFAAAAFAAVAWFGRPQTRPLAIGLALLLVAGLQPQALHHGMTAFLGLILMSSGSLRPEPQEPRLEAANGV